MTNTTPKLPITLVGHASRLQRHSDHASFLLTVKGRGQRPELLVECHAHQQADIERFELMADGIFVGVIGTLQPIEEQHAHSILRLDRLEILGKATPQQEGGAVTTLPTIHLNGTGADNLEREYRAVRKAVAATADALAVATCNARDFYPQDPWAWRRAQAERAEAFRLLQQVSDYAEAWELHAINHRRGREGAAGRSADFVV